MHVYDVNGDKLNDVVTSLRAHSYGLAWYEQKRDAQGKISFVEHIIMEKDPALSKGVVFTELHSVVLADVDGDGLKDIVTGKNKMGFGASFTYQYPDEDNEGVLLLVQADAEAEGPGRMDAVSHRQRARGGPSAGRDRSEQGWRCRHRELRTPGCVRLLRKERRGRLIRRGRCEMSEIRRRDFLLGSAMAVGAAYAARGQRAYAAQELSSSDKAKLERVACMTLCFASILKNPSMPDDPKRTLDIMDAPAMLADRYGIHNVEVTFTHLLSTEPAYLREFRERVRKAGSRVSQISIGQLTQPLNISNENPVIRLQCVDLTKRWIDHAAELGCPRLMIHQGSLAPEVRQGAIAAVKAMVEYGKSRKVSITVENRDTGGGGRGRGRRRVPTRPVVPTRPQVKRARHGAAPGGRGGAAPAGVASWEATVEVIKASGAYANPDTCNFPSREAHDAGLRVMYTMTAGSSHLHYTPNWDEADGIRIAKEVGYKGLFSIEVAKRGRSVRGCAAHSRDPVTEPLTRVNRQKTPEILK